MASQQVPRRKPVPSRTLLPHNTNLESATPLIKQAVYSESCTTALNKDVADLPPGWPASANAVKSSTFSVVSDILVDVALLALSVAFLTFGLVVRAYNEVPVLEHQALTQALLNVSKYGPTVYPILFACVVGRAAHSILVWRLEKGEHIGVLDILAGCSSLTSTVISQLNLGYFSFLGFTLIVIWALSPIGGQASLRQIDLSTKNDTTLTTLKYYVPNGDMARYDNSDRNQHYGVANSLFVASLVSSDQSQTATTDLWGNVKVPMIESYENRSLTDGQGWITTQKSHNVYSSLVGVPTSVQNMHPGEDNAMYTFNLETSYMHMDCVSAKHYGAVPKDAASANNIFMWSNINGTQNDAQRFNVDMVHLEPRLIYFGQTYADNVVQCNTTTTYVELHVECNTSSTCATSQLRRSQLDHPPPAFTLLDNYGTNGWRYYAAAFVNTVIGYPSGPTALTNYIYSNQNSSGRSVATSLSQMLNTYSWCLFTENLQTNGLLPNATGNSTTPIMAKVNITNVATADGARMVTFDIIQCHTSWTVALCIASTILIIATLIPPITRHFYIRGPDLLLNFSSLAVRDNRYVALPLTGTFMNASTRAKLSRNFRVRFGDVRDKRDVGRLAIGSLGESGPQNVAYLRRGRLYE